MQTWPGCTGTGVRGDCRVVTCPAALVHQPVDEGADGVGQRLSRSAIADTLRLPYGRGTGSATTDGCAPIGSRLGRQRDVAGLQRVGVLDHRLGERRR